MPPLDRRSFLATSSAFAALIASGCTARGNLGSGAGFAGYGALQADPAGVLDLPQGFSYRVISRFGDAMDDGGTVPDNADGMGAFALPDGKIALVRNHELTPDLDGGGASGPAYDTIARSLVPLPGGTTNVVLDRYAAKDAYFKEVLESQRNFARTVVPYWTKILDLYSNLGNAALKDSGHWSAAWPTRVVTL